MQVRLLSSGLGACAEALFGCPGSLLVLYWVTRKGAGAREGADLEGSATSGKACGTGKAGLLSVCPEKCSVAQVPAGAGEVESASVILSLPCEVETIVGVTVPSASPSTPSEGWGSCSPRGGTWCPLVGGFGDH